MHAQFLTAGLADELHLVVAPFFVGDRRAPRFVGDGRVPVAPGSRGPGWPRPARSATWCWSATPSRSAAPSGEPTDGSGPYHANEGPSGSLRCVVAANSQDMSDKSIPQA